MNRLRPSAPVQLYRHFDVKGRLLYVGISKNAGTRYAGHRRNSAWASASVRMTIEMYPDRLSASTAELKAIETEKPLHNLNHLERLSIVKLPKMLEKPRRLEETMMLSARVPVSLVNQMNSYCTKKNRSRSELMEEALKKFLKKA